MAETTYFPRRLILAGAMITGVLLALAVHMLGARYGLDLGGLWRADTKEFIPAGAAVAWWLIATVGFSGGYFTASLMASAVSGQIPQRMRQFLIAVGVLLLAGAGRIRSASRRPLSVSGMSVVPVCWPLRLQAVSPCRMTKVSMLALSDPSPAATRHPGVNDRH